MSKIELEIKTNWKLKEKMASSSYNSKAEWLREQIRNFLAK